MWRAYRTRRAADLATARHPRGGTIGAIVTRPLPGAGDRDATDPLDTGSPSGPIRRRRRMSDIEQSGFAEFDGWRALARRTRELLDAAILEGGLPAGGADVPRRPDPAPHRGRPDRIRRLAPGGRGRRRGAPVPPRARRRDPGRAADDGRRATGRRRRASMERSLAARDGAGPTIRGRRAVEPRGAGPRPAGPRAAAGDPRRRRSATPRAAGPTPTSPDRADPRSSPAGSRSSSDTSGGPRPAAPPDPADSGFRRAYGFFDAADQLGGPALRGAA